MKNENILNGSKTETMDSDFANELIKEWIYWLSYVSEEDKAKLEEIKAKKGSELTDIEKRILSDYQVERKILEALKRYSNKSSKDTNQELMQIFLNNNIAIISRVEPTPPPFTILNQVRKPPLDQQSSRNIVPLVTRLKSIYK